MAESTIAIGSTVTGSGEDVDTFAFTVQANKKLVMQITGSTSVIAGIWTGKEVVKGQGVLRLCGSGDVRGTHLFKAAGPCVIQVQNQTGGDYSLTLRNWSLADYVTIGWHKSTC